MYWSSTAYIQVDARRKIFVRKGDALVALDRIRDRADGFDFRKIVRRGRLHVSLHPSLHLSPPG